MADKARRFPLGPTDSGYALSAGGGLSSASAPEPAKGIRINDDFHGWLLDQASLLRDRRYDALDWRNIAEELEAIAKRDERELKARLTRLLHHLLKWKWQQTQLHKRGASWRRTTREQRRRLNDLLGDSPSLSAKADEFLPEAYKRALEDAVDDIGLSSLPKACPWELQRITAG